QRAEVPRHWGQNRSATGSAASNTEDSCAAPMTTASPAAQILVSVNCWLLDPPILLRAGPQLGRRRALAHDREVSSQSPRTLPHSDGQYSRCRLVVVVEDATPSLTTAQAKVAPFCACSLNIRSRSGFCTSHVDC